MLEAQDFARSIGAVSGGLIAWGLFELTCKVSKKSHTKDSETIFYLVLALVVGGLIGAFAAEILIR